MSEKLLKILLADLSTVRFKCVNCKTVTELEMKNIKVRVEYGKCPACGNQWVPSSENHLVNLAETVAKIRDRKDAVEVEFVLPDSEPKPKSDGK